MLFRKTVRLRRPRRLCCSPGWSGADCQTPLCVQECANRGECVAPDTCECKYGWFDANCTTPVLRDDVRQRRQLHGAGHVHVPLAMEWRRLPRTRSVNRNARTVGGASRRTRANARPSGTATTVGCRSATKANLKLMARRKRVLEYQKVIPL